MVHNEYLNGQLAACTNHKKAVRKTRAGQSGSANCSVSNRVLASNGPITTATPGRPRKFEKAWPSSSRPRSAWAGRSFRPSMSNARSRRLDCPKRNVRQDRRARSQRRRTTRAARAPGVDRHGNRAGRTSPPDATLDDTHVQAGLSTGVDGMHQAYAAIEEGQDLDEIIESGPPAPPQDPDIGEGATTSHKSTRTTNSRGIRRLGRSTLPQPLGTRPLVLGDHTPTLLADSTSILGLVRRPTTLEQGSRSTRPRRRRVVTAGQVIRAPEVARSMPTVRAAEHTGYYPTCGS